jgi:hypothetical protein
VRSVLQGAGHHVGPDSLEGSRGGLRAGQAHDLVPGREQFRDDRGPDEPGSTGDEDAHQALQPIVSRCCMD